MVLAHLWSLVKPRIVALLTLTGTTALIAAGGAPPVQTAAFVIAGAAIAGGSAALNCIIDRDIDPRMTRTATRPLATGALAVGTATAFAAALLAVGTIIALAALPPTAVAAMWGGVLAYVGLYTLWLKRVSRLGVVLGGSAGAFPVLAGWVTVAPIGVEPVLLAALVFVWTPAHAWALAYVYREDFARVDVPTLPAVTPADRAVTLIWVGAVATAVTAIAATPLGGPVYGTAAVAGAPLFLWAYHRLRVTGDDAAAVRAFFTSNGYLAVLFLAWAAGATHAGPATVLATAVLTPATILGLWSRRPSLRGVPAPPFPTWPATTRHDPPTTGVQGGIAAHSRSRGGRDE